MGRMMLFSILERARELNPEAEGSHRLMNRARLRAASVVAGAGLLLVPAIASAKAKFDPSTEFSINAYLHLKVGPIDLSVNKAVIYLLITTVILCVIAPLVVRAGLRSRPGKGQNVVELAYEFAEGQIGRADAAGQGLPDVVPVSRHAVPVHRGEQRRRASSRCRSRARRAAGVSSLPDFGLYAATANINVTLTLRPSTFLITHIVGSTRPRVRGVPQDVGPGRTTGHQALHLRDRDPVAALAAREPLGTVCSPTCWPATC